MYFDETYHKYLLPGPRDTDDIFEVSKRFKGHLRFTFSENALSRGGMYCFLGHILVLAVYMRCRGVCCVYYILTVANVKTRCLSLTRRTA